MEGTFSGGPDGVITIENHEYKLKEGKYFEYIGGGKTFKYTVENPEIFSKYNWGGSANTKESKSEENKLEDSGATIKNVSRNVEVNLPNPDGTYDEKNWKLAVDLDDDIESLPVGTHIRTWAFGRAVLSFDDGTIFKMAAKSEIVLLSPAAKRSKVKLLPGAYQANIKTKIQDPDYEIDMDQMVMVIQGTILVLEETGSKSTVKVIEGSVSVKSKTSGQSETINTGETITADANGLGQKTTFDVVSENASWDALEKETRESSPQLNNFAYAGLAVLAVVIIGAVLKFRKKKAVK